MKILKIFGLMAILGGSLMSQAAETPVYPGGSNALSKYLSENTVYPEIAKENGIEGIVSVGFIVAADGSLSNLRILNAIDPDLEKEAMRVVTGMPAWIPAEKDGTPFEAPSQVEVPFILE